MIKDGLDHHSLVPLHIYGLANGRFKATEINGTSGDLMTKRKFRLSSKSTGSVQSYT